tara:strand:- start:70 stop:249 length:180 start_codon:yes stop_codon:yes gene_type:complete
MVREVIWVLSGGEFEEFEVILAFRTREAAEAKVEEFHRESRGRHRKKSSGYEVTAVVLQ